MKTTRIHSDRLDENSSRIYSLFITEIRVARNSIFQGGLKMNGMGFETQP
jgi:hypothetical protein